MPGAVPSYWGTVCLVEGGIRKVTFQNPCLAYLKLHIFIEGNEITMTVVPRLWPIQIRAKFIQVP